MGMKENSNGRDGLIDDLKLVIKDAEEMLRGTGAQVDQGYQQARARFQSTLSSARTNLSGLEEQVSATAREKIEQTNEFVRENPWQAVGAGAVAGLIVGILLGRR